MNRTRGPSHFAKLYQASPDPWGFETDPYEHAKYRHSVETLGDRRFVSALEAGCSVGVLTRMLAPRCEALLALDIVDEPLAVAAKRCAGQPWVQFQRTQVPDDWPDGRFDLIVLSEMLYFLSPADIDRCARRVEQTALSGAIVLLVNWLGRSDDPCSGDEAAERFLAATAGALSVLRQERLARYRLDLLTAG
jgi:SAM-dependent methyltransferase